jgi:hypothetical protein
MKRSALFALAAVLCSTGAPAAFAATEDLDLTVYIVDVRRGEEISLPKGGKVFHGGTTQATIVNKNTGETTVQWCSAAAFVDAAGNPTNMVGACTVFYDSGDMLWVSYLNGTMDQPNTWAVMGGTGRFAGATGGGSCKVDSQRSDGYSITSSCTGKLTTK